ncbi:MAG: type I methionyl aminopeptidase [Chromatiales bacterium]|jgi:methionyl aminopeptidase|nr:type I methionyl aminopeptidase [Chromatiales bacterium]MDX9767817.1 type I methionyl aminopeptidase [Ectothiorhodospiraceae bacterium]
MTIETQQDIEGLRRIGRIVALVLQEMERQARPGMTTRELDAIGRAELDRHGARSAPEITYGFPGATCISINEEAAHGVPGERVIQPGDMVNVDVSAELDGYVADTGGSFVMPPVSTHKRRLCAATRFALEQAVAEVTAGRPLNVIGRTIEGVARQHGYRIIRNLGSHGVGRHLHEEPKFIPGYHDPRERRRLEEGMVITIEPFLSTRAEAVREADDGWTLRAPRGNLSAQYEHTLIVTRGRPIVVTTI